MPRRQPRDACKAVFSSFRELINFLLTLLQFPDQRASVDARQYCVNVLRLGIGSLSDGGESQEKCDGSEDSKFRAAVLT